MHRTKIWGAVVCLALATTMTFAAESTMTTPEETRQALQQLMNDYTVLAPGNDQVAARADRLNQRLESMSFEEMQTLHRALVASPLMERGMQTMRSAAEAVEFGQGADDSYTANVVDPVYSLECGDVRVDAATAKSQLDMWEALQFATAAAQAACDEDALECAAAQTAREAAITARFVYENTLFCWADINGAETTALGGTLAELETAIGNISSDFQDAIDAQTMTLQDALDAQTMDLTGVIDMLGMELKALLQQVLDNQATMLDNQAAILVNQDAILAGQDEIKSLLLTPPGRRPGWNNRPNNTGTDSPGNSGNSNGRGN